MKKNDIVLAVVAVAAMIASGLVARKLHAWQIEIAPSRAMLTGVPMAGFQKLAADVHWMLLLQYGGRKDVTAETAPEFERRIMRIASMDPDFSRNYHMGVLMLGAVDTERALKIADRALEHPNARKEWKVPALAAQLLWNKEALKYYKGEPMDLKQVARARQYYRAAISAPGCPPNIFRGYIRTVAALKEDTHDLEIKVLDTWYDQWQNQLDTDMLGATMYEEGNTCGQDVEELLLQQIRHVRDKHPDNPTANALIDKVLAEVFADRHLDPVSLMPYGPGDRYSAHSGAKVEVYGVCNKCEAILKGRYCHQCGADNKQDPAPTAL